MTRIVFKDLPLRTTRFQVFPKVLHWVLFGLFLVQLAVVAIRLFRPAFCFREGRWPEGMLVVLAAAATLAALGRNLPGQNVLTAALIVAFIGSAAQTLGALTGIPFGPFAYTEAIGQKLFEPLPWAVPLMWLIILFNARGVARLVLRPWRQARNYGWWLMGLTVLVVVLFDAALEPFATTVKGYWTWQKTLLSLEWYGAPVVNFLGWGLTALLMLLVVTAWLLNKKPGKQPPDYYPLCVWLLVNLVFLAGAAARQLWPAAVFTLCTCVAIGALAGWGGLNPSPEIRDPKERRNPNPEPRG